MVTDLAGYVACGPEALAQRRQDTAELLKALDDNARLNLPEPDWRRACVYVTGSLARAEATRESDLDAFIVDDLGTDTERPRLNLVERAELVHMLDVTRRDATITLGFSGGGKYLEVHSFEQMLEGAGKPQDDASNRFTARMLLLINSRHLVNENGWNKCRERVLDHYWRDERNPNAPYLPVFLFNDIRRLWHTFCLNFESELPPTQIDAYTSDSSAERRIGNLKLRTARLLACYTPIVGILHESTEAGVTRNQAQDVLVLSQTARLERLASSEDTAVAALANNILTIYGGVLAFLGEPKTVQHTTVANRSNWNEWKDASGQIGHDIAALMAKAGEGKNLGRYAIV